MDRLSIPALASVLFATALFSALTGIGNGLVRDVYGPIFAILVFLQLGLGFEFALYEASLPTTGQGTVLGRWVERWVEGRSSQQMSLQLN